MMEPCSNTTKIDKKSPLSAHTFYPIHSLQKQGIFPCEPCMMMSAFNTSSSRENMSLRLRAQNMRSAKEQTKKLELESRKMEERLKELKVAMSREKEERERSGGGFWRTGQSGTLSSYATHVLDKPTKHSAKETKKKTIKVLKDEPLDLPSRSSEPGTMKYIAKTSQMSVKENRVKGPKCGQCEDRAACLTCVQCSEHYCSGCFAAFHLRGALKKHRSVPLQASGPRQCMSPRPTPPPSFRGEGKEESPAVGAVSSSVKYQESERNRPEGASGSYESSSLLGGQYNEAESAASFQAALQAWRNGDTPESSPRLSVAPSPNKSLYASPRKPAMSVDSSTSTSQQPPSPTIKFSNTISYADRLLLKQHRRTDPGGLGEDDYPSPRSTALSHSSQALFSRDNTLDVTEDSRVRFSALYQASLTDVNAAHSKTTQPQSSLAIVELQDSQGRGAGELEQTGDYQVQEVSSFEAWQLDSYRKSPGSIRSASQLTNMSRTGPGHQHRARDSSMSRVEITDLTGSALEPSSIQNRSNQDSLIDQRFKHLRNQKQKDEIERPKSRPASRKARQSARPRSSRQSRPNSRALSRAGTTLREGTLTKSPSSALKEIASRLQQTETQVYSPSLQDFFLVGVKPHPQERSLTPSTLRTTDTIKVSNRLYQMAPRSWRPDSSLGESVPLQERYGSGSGSGTQRESVISYTYSSQLQQQHPDRCESPVEGVSNSQTSSRVSHTPPSTDRRSAEKQSGRTSRIVMEGEDLSRYDEVDVDCNQEDMETLHQLEWELASESGRLTADGQMSRLSVMDSMSDSEGSSRSSTPLIKLSMDKGFDINIKLREDELNETVDENANHTKDEQDVKELH